MGILKIIEIARNCLINVDNLYLIAISVRFIISNIAKSVSFYLQAN